MAQKFPIFLNRGPTNYYLFSDFFTWVRPTTKQFSGFFLTLEKKILTTKALPGEGGQALVVKITRTFNCTLPFSRLINRVLKGDAENTIINT